MRGLWIDLVVHIVSLCVCFITEEAYKGCIDRLNVMYLVSFAFAGFDFNLFFCFSFCFFVFFIISSIHRGYEAFGNEGIEYDPFRSYISGKSDFEGKKGERNV